MTKYIAFLRGINVGGHHKVPMAELRKEMGEMGFANIITLLNSGNVIFEGPATQESTLEDKIAAHLEKNFGFPIPVLVRTAGDMHTLLDDEPFREVNVTKDIRLYVSFIKEEPQKNLAIPWVSDDGAYHIIQVKDRVICSVVDLRSTQTTKAMAMLEQHFGKNITTRNWNTIGKIGKKLN